MKNRHCNKDKRIFHSNFSSSVHTWQLDPLITADLLSREQLPKTVSAVHSRGSWGRRGGEGGGGERGCNLDTSVQGGEEKEAVLLVTQLIAGQQTCMNDWSISMTPFFQKKTAHASQSGSDHCFDVSGLLYLVKCHLAGR